MKEIIGVRFRPNGKIYYFDPQNFEVEAGSFVIVETARGVEYGKVVLGRREVEEGKITASLKPIIRIATEDDTRRYEDNKKKSKRAFGICLEKIAKHKLDMKLIEAEYTFDNNKVLFYFTADRRIDFRELVKDLASVFKTRIELRQIGVRDETKMVGGIGICGRELCCNKHLSEFVPVSIKMAKEQNLSLNPTKISGVCGRLMCCLKNEQETYEYLNSRMPNVGDIVVSRDGTRGEVKSLNVLRQYVKVLVENGDEKEMREFAVDDLKFTPGRRKDVKVTAEELKELEGLEDNDETAEEKPKPRNRGNNQNRNRQRNNGDDKRDNTNAVRENNQQFEQKSSDMERADDNRPNDNRPNDNRSNDNRQNDNRNHYNKNRRSRYKGKRNDNGNRNTNRQQSDTQ